jgi:Methyltransferase domain
MKISNLRRKTAYFFASPGTFISAGLTGAREVYFRKHLLKKYKSVSLPSISIQDLIGNESSSLNTYSFLPGTSMITDIILLKALAKRFQHCTYLEIGSWRGESLVNVAEVAGECYSLSLSDKEMKDFGYPASVAGVSDFFIKDTRNIKLIKHNSQTYDFKVLNKKFDLIFIDGDHSYNGVINDTRNAIKLLKDENSIIVWHDYGFTTEDVHYAVLSAIFDGLPSTEHNHLYHVSNTLSAIYCKGKFDSRMVVQNEKPDKVFSIELKVKKY